MKVIFFGGSIPPKTGGEVTDFKLYQFIRSKGIEADFIPLTDFKKKVSIKLSGLLKWRYLIRIFEMIFFCIHFWRKRGTILFIDYYCIRSTFLYLLIQKYLFRSNTLVCVHHFDHYRSSEKDSIKKKFKIWKERISFSLIDKILTVSGYGKKEIISLGVHPEKIAILSPGIDIGNLDIKRKNFINKKTGFNILFVGHCFPRKGIKYLIEAINELDQYHFTLDIVGDTGKDPKYYDSLVSFIVKNGLTNKVNFYGRVNQERLSEFYSNADIFILPSLWEGFGIVLLEAMYFKLPIIASSVAAIPELVKDGENGLLVPPQNPNSLALAIKKLIENPGLRKSMGENAYKKVINSYSWQSAGEKFYQILREISGR